MKKIILLIIIFSLTGCWNYRELNNLAITTGVAIDKEGNNFLVTLMIANSKKQNSTETKNESASVVYSGQGATFYEAFKDAAMAASKEIYLSHIETLIISEEVAKNDLIDAIDFLFRYPQIRNSFYVVIANNCKAGDVLKINLPLEFYPSQSISKNLETTSSLQAYTDAITFDEFIKYLLEDGIDAILPSISIIGDVEKGNSEENLEQSETDTYLKLESLAVFQGDKFLKFTTREESKGINMLKNKIEATEINTDINGEKVLVEVTNSKTKFKYNFKTEYPTIDITIDMNGAIEEVAASLDLNDLRTIKLIKEKIEEKVSEIAYKSIDFMQENKIDVIGFGKQIHQVNYKYWNKIKDTWENEGIQESIFNVKVNLSLETKGNSNTTLKEE